MGQTLHIASPAIIGIVIFLLFGSSAAGQMTFRNLADRRLILLGSVAIIVSMAALILALELGSLGVLIAASAGLAGATTIFAIGVTVVSAPGLLGLRRLAARA